MNRRQKLKHMKRDNKLMRDIIRNTPEMEWLYNAYCQPCNATYHTMNFQKYTCKRIIPPYMADLKEYEEHMKLALVGDLARVIEKDIQFDVVDMYGTKEIYATIYIGRK